VGGVEHAVLHLLYARFYTKFLYDIGVVDFQEPFVKLFNQGMVTRNGKKMSKSLGSGVSPDDILPKYGCDALRMYELFIGPPELDAEWDDSGIDGVYRYLNKVWRLADDTPIIDENPDIERTRHRLIYDITTRLESLSLNTVISGFMEHTNTLISLSKTYGGISKNALETLAVLLAPFAPHMAEELWEKLGNATSVFASRWPEYDEAKLVTDTVEIAMQINGKLRGNIQVSANADKDSVVGQAREALGGKLDGVEVVKVIYVQGRIVNFVVR